MAKQTINPDAQAAPFLGESSHDPIEFTRRFGERRREEKEKAELKKEKEISSSLQNMDKFIGEAKGWADQKNFQEIMAEREKLRDLYVSFGRQGLNLQSPQTEAEVTFNKEMMKRLTGLQSKVNLYNENKEILDLIQKQMLDPNKKALINEEATVKNIQDALDSGDVESMNKILRSAIVTKPQREDIIKQINSIRPQLPLPQTTERVVTDGEGNQTIQKETMLSPQAEKETVRKLKLYYAGLSPEQKESVKMNFEDAKEMDRLYPQAEGEERVPPGWSEEDYYVYMAHPEYRSSFSEKPKGAGGLEIDVFGGKMKMPVGQLVSTPQVFGTGQGGKTFSSAYKFDSKNNLKINIGESGSQVFRGEEWENLEGGGDMQAQLVFYDSQKDEFVFRVTSNNSQPYLKTGETVSVPRNVLGNLVDDLRIKDFDGKQKKLKDIFGPTQVVKRDPGVVWDKETPATSKEKKVKPPLKQ